MDEQLFKQLIDYSDCEVSNRQKFVTCGLLPPDIYSLIAQELFLNGYTSQEHWRYCHDIKYHTKLKPIPDSLWNNVCNYLKDFESGFLTPEMFPYRLQLKTPLKTKSKFKYAKCVRYKEVKLPSK